MFLLIFLFIFGSSFAQPKAPIQSPLEIGILPSRLPSEKEPPKSGPPDSDVSDWYNWAGGPVADWYNAPEEAFVGVTSAPTVEDWYEMTHDELGAKEDSVELSPEEKQLNSAIGDAVKVIQAARLLQEISQTTAAPPPPPRIFKPVNPLKQQKEPKSLRNQNKPSINVNLAPRASAALAVAGPNAGASAIKNGATNTNDEALVEWYDLPQYSEDDSQLPVDIDTGGLVTKCSIGVGYACGNGRKDTDPYRVCICSKGTLCTDDKCENADVIPKSDLQTREIKILEVFIPDLQHPDGGRIIEKVDVENVGELPARGEQGQQNRQEVKTTAEPLKVATKVVKTVGRLNRNRVTTQAPKTPTPAILFPDVFTCTLNLGDTCNPRFLSSEQQKCTCGAGLKCGRLVCITDRSSGAHRQSLLQEATKKNEKRHNVAENGEHYHACIIAEGRSCRYFGNTSNCRCHDGLECNGRICAKP